MKSFLLPLLLIISIHSLSQKRQEELKNLELAQGFYVTGGLGDSWKTKIINNREDQTISATLGPINYQRRSEMTVKEYITTEAGLGYKFGNNLRAELSYLYGLKSAISENTTGTLFYSTGSMDFNGQTQVSGKIKKHALLTHLIYDLATKSRWAPFIGVGIGFARINSTDMKYDYTVVYSNGTSVSGTRTEPGGKGNTFAYQGKIGVNYLLSKRSALYLSANYFNITRTDLGGGTIYEGFNITSIKAGLLLNIKN